jgi:hypothetical protein
MVSDPGVVELGGRELLINIAYCSPAFASPDDGIAQMRRAIATHRSIRKTAQRRGRAAPYR